MPLTLAPDNITFFDSTTITPTTIKWTVINTTTNLIVFNKYVANTSAGSFTVNLPPSPVDGDFITIVDGFGTWQSNNLVINRNGKNINSLIENLICDVNYGKVELIWSQINNSWRTSI